MCFLIETVGKCYERHNDGDSLPLGFDDRRGQWVVAVGNDGLLCESDKVEKKTNE
jgi:hypothetical protein